MKQILTEENLSSINWKLQKLEMGLKNKQFLISKFRNGPNNESSDSWNFRPTING